MSGCGTKYLFSKVNPFIVGIFFLNGHYNDNLIFHLQNTAKSIATIYFFFLNAKLI